MLTPQSRNLFGVLSRPDSTGGIFQTLKRQTATAGFIALASQRYNSGRALKEVIALIDAEIATLRKARALLAAGSAVTVAKRKAGRPPKVQPGTATIPKRKKKRNLSPEGRARIAEAAKKRWAAQRKAAK